MECGKYKSGSPPTLTPPNHLLNFSGPKPEINCCGKHTESFLWELSLNNKGICLWVVCVCLDSHGKGKGSTISVTSVAFWLSPLTHSHHMWRLWKNQCCNPETNESCFFFFFYPCSPNRCCAIKNNYNKISNREMFFAKGIFLLFSCHYIGTHVMVGSPVWG